MNLAGLCDRIEAAPKRPHRRVIAVAGPPASGKSTLAAVLADGLMARGHEVAVVPMDGFHLDNLLLDEDGTRARKGAPETFDATGFVRLVSALQSQDDVVFPLFDRSRDIAIAGAERVRGTCATVIAEGNYLLLDADPWRKLKDHWSMSVLLAPTRDVLKSRLLQRWRDQGLSEAQAEARATSNDMKNVDLVARACYPADVTLTEALT